jgi:hypothetical protein
MNTKKIILRILVSPVILLMLMITYLFYSIMRWLSFMRYGGEFINYEKDDHITIKMIYRSLKADSHE